MVTSPSPKTKKGAVYVKHANSKDPDKGDLDNGEITIKGGKRSEDTPPPAAALLKAPPRKISRQIHVGHAPIRRQRKQ